MRLGRRVCSESRQEVMAAETGGSGGGEEKWIDQRDI